MAVVLLILKIIGITLLVLLLLIILVLMALLFVPLRYRVRLSIDGDSTDDTDNSEHVGDGERINGRSNTMGSDNGTTGSDDGTTELDGGTTDSDNGRQNRNVSFRARAYWLLHLIAAEVSYEDGQADAFLRILFWRKKLLNNKETEEEEETVKEDAKEKAYDIADEAVKPPKQAKPLEQKKSEEIQGSSAENPSEKTVSADGNDPELSEKDVVTDSSKQSKGSESEKSSGQPEIEAESSKKTKSSSRKPGIAARLKKIFNDISTLRKKITYVLEDERNKRAFSRLKINLIKILKAIMPRKLSMDLQFSMGSPDITGEVLGVCALFPVLYQPGNHLSPDFQSDQAYAKGNVNARGRIYLYQILFPVLGVVFDKNCKRLYRMLKKYFG